MDYLVFIFKLVQYDDIIGEALIKGALSEKGDSHERD
jgi:hypothetical protein